MLDRIKRRPKEPLNQILLDLAVESARQSEDDHVYMCTVTVQYTWSHYLVVSETWVDTQQVKLVSIL